MYRLPGKLVLFSVWVLAAAGLLWHVPATAQVKGHKPPGMGGKKKKPNPARIVTKAKFTGVLNTVSANPYLLRIRAEYGGKHDKKFFALTGLPPRTTARVIPKSVDWRNRWGTNWITSVANQGQTENCWAFASNALVEAMIRIEHGVWCSRAVVEMRKGVKKKITDGGNPSEALLWASQHGLADTDCSPYSLDDKPLVSAPDRSGRTVRMPQHARIPNDANMASAKKWLDAVGPLVTYMEVFTDFDDPKNVVGKVYHKNPNYPGLKSRGGHLILIVGYDDGAKCWICKNSWGTSFGDKGFFRIGYGEASIDSDEKYGLRLTNPDPYVKQRMHSGTMIESGNGSLHRNFEMLVTEAGQLRHHWREGSDLKWHKAELFGPKHTAAQVTLIATTQNRNFEAIHLTTAKRLHAWGYDQSAKKWVDGGTFGPKDAAGVPGLTQMRILNANTREVVVRTADGKLNHWSRPVSQPKGWKDLGRFGADVAHSGASLVQLWNAPKVNGVPEMSANAPKNGLDCVAVLKSGKMQQWNYQPGRTPAWQAGTLFGDKIASPPCMIEGQYGAKDESVIGNYELCVAVGGKVEHWWRNNGGNQAWQKSAVFGSNIKEVASLIEGSYGFNLEVIVRRTDNKLQHYWRDGKGWHAGVIVG